MKYLMMASFMCSMLVFGGETRSFEVGTQPKLSLSNISGSVRITKGESRNVTVTWHAGSDREKVIAEQKGNKIVVRVDHSRGGGGHVDFEVSFPAEGDLDIGTISGNLTVSGVGGDISLVTVSGNIEGDSLKGEIQAQTVSGMIHLTKLDPEELQANSVSGSIDYSGSMKSGEYQFNTTSGSVSLQLPKEASVTLEGNTMSGTITTERDGINVEVEKYTHLKQMNGTLGKGDASVSVNTLSGSITVK